MKAVLYLKKWIKLPEFGAPITETSPFGQMAFSHYSNKISSGEDERLTDPKWLIYGYGGVLGRLKKVLYWKLCLILEPVGSPNTRFKIGYCSKYGGRAVSPFELEVGDGPFALRVGPRDRDFFIIGEKAVSLEKVGFIRSDDPRAKQGKYKKIKIY